MSIPRICPVCDAPFMIKPAFARIGRGIYCSRQCYKVAKGLFDTPEERFWRQVDKASTPDGCWPWQGYCLPSGYGTFSVMGYPMYTHVFAYELIHGLLLPGFCACHTCDNPPCCREEHIFPGTQAINMADMCRKGRQTSGERDGQAKLTDAKVLEIRSLANIMTRTAIARQFDISVASASLIIRHKSWKHLP